MATGRADALGLYAAALFIDLPAPFSGSAAWLFVAYSVSCGVIIFFGNTAREAIQRLKIEIAEHQRTREALLKANVDAAKLEMAAMLAHSINNSLASMVSATYLLRTSGGTAEQPVELRTNTG